MQRFCLIGHPVKHSCSPQMHNAVFAELQISARYELCDVLPETLGEFMRTYRETFAGGNVTIPHKEVILGYLDEIEPVAREIGAVNAIANRNGKLVGTNTDWIGALEALREGFGDALVRNEWVRGKIVLIVGAGGAAKALAYGAAQAGARIIILNRTFQHAQEIAEKYHGEFGSLSDFQKFSPDIVVNATSVGLSPNSTVSPIAKEAFSVWQAAQKTQEYSQALLAMDMIFNPRITKFLQDAKEAGCATITGDRMLINQGVAAFTFWTGKTPPRSVMEEVVADCLS